MAFTVGDLVARLRVDNSGFVTGMQGAEDSLERLKGTVATLGLSAVFLAVARDAFMAAGALDQVERAFSATFGKMEDSADAFAVSLSKALSVDLTDVRREMTQTQ